MQFEPLAPVPAVTLARTLREVPLFRYASVDELFRIATICQQVRYEADATVQTRGARAEYIQVLLEGQFEIEREGRPATLADPPVLVGFREVLEGNRLQDRATARADSIALVLEAQDFRTLISANIELAQGLFRTLLMPGGHGGAPALSHTSTPAIAAVPDQALKTVDKALYWQTVPVFGRTSGDELYSLAAISREVELVPDETVFTEGHASAMWLVLSGALELERPESEEKLRATAGSCVGVNETLAGADWKYRATVVEQGRALSLARDLLFELLADRMELLQGIFGAVFLDGRDAQQHEDTSS